jgi:undecaprenyl-diphosphatase
MEFLYSIDRTVFLFFNRTVANPVFDFIMPIITELDYWRIPIFLMLLALLIFGGKKGRIVVLLVAIIVTMSDQLSSHVIKPLVGRTRPCFVVEGVRLLIHQSRSFSFTSSHASNMAAMATLFSVKYPRYKIAFITLAALVAYSRIYVGVHYPADILGGAILGTLCAAIVLWIERRIVVIWHRRKALKEARKDVGEEPSDTVQEGA